MLGRGRILAWSGVLLIAELLTLAFITAGTHGLIVTLDRPASTDFVSFYAAGALADAGTPALAYHAAEHYAAEQQATQAGIGYVLFFYPPVFLLLCAPLARLPYLAAFLVFAGLTLAPYLLVLQRVVGERGWAAMLPGLAFPAVLWSIGIGQNALLTASLFGAATLLLDRRPAMAGLLFGALCYKPHLGLLVPVALAAGGHWRSFVAAGASALGLVLLSVVAFGVQTWHDFFAAFAGSPEIYQSGQVTFTAMVSVFGAARLLGLPPAAAYAAQGVAALLAAGFVAVVWRRRPSLPLRAASLIAATLEAVPLLLFYDLVLACVAIAWLVREARAAGYLPGEKLVFGGIFLVPLISRSAASGFTVPIGPLAGAALIGLVMVHLRTQRPGERRRLGASGRSVAPLHGGLTIMWDG
ncbi:MAG: DUF2029 domain-containing protein [Acidisphaera sp.]|nr:DUF2029 domain-containing protein [Acidisphaera sp.]